MYPLKIIGLGPGHPDYILPIALKEIAAAEVILCGTRHAESFDASGKEIERINPFAADPRNRAGRVLPPELAKRWPKK